MAESGAIDISGRPSGLRVLELLGDADPCGAAAVVVQLVPALPSTVHAAVVVPREGACAQRLRALGAQVVAFPVDAERGLARSVMRTAELVRRLRIDVIHAHLGNAHAVAAIVSAATGVPTLATIQGDAVPMRDVEVLARGWSRLAVVCEAAYAHARLVGADAARVALVPNGVDADAFAPGPRGTLRAEWDVPDGVPLVGFAGRLAPENAPDDFVHACVDVSARRPDAHFVVVGEGALRHHCTEIACERGIAERMHFLGRPVAMRPFYRELDVLLVTSRAEGAPLFVLEAMATAVPVVAARAGGLPEIVVDRECGLLFDVGDVVAGAGAVCTLLADAAMRSEMGRASRERARARFALRRHVERTVVELARTARGGLAPLRESGPAAGSRDEAVVGGGARGGRE